MSTAPQPLADHAANLIREGYTVVRDALTAAELAPIRARYDELMDEEFSRARALKPEVRHCEIRRILERDPVFAPLMDWPRILPLATAAIGRDITLASAGEADFRPGNTAAYISWHNDFEWMVDVPYPRQNAWIRCTYFLDDVSDDMGPFTLLPGSHRESRACPSQELTDEHGQPRYVPGQVGITGPAGTCLVNNTEIWHTNTANRSDRPRKLIMICYKHSWMRQWEDGYDLTPAFVAAQTDPMRQQLCGASHWHRVKRDWVVPEGASAPAR